jgi:hypothetical protein
LEEAMFNHALICESFGIEFLGKACENIRQYLGTSDQFSCTKDQFSCTKRVPKMSVQTIYMNDPTKAVIICAQCGLTKSADVSKYLSPRKSVKIKCKCGHTFEVTFERRKYHRRETRLIGEYSDGTFSYEMVVTSLSLGGVGFEVHDPSRLKNIKVDEVYEVTFDLDDEHRSRIDTKVIVKAVDNLLVRGQFVDLEHDSQKKLGFYLMP